MADKVKLFALSRLTLSTGLIFALGTTTTSFRPALSAVEPICKSADDTGAFLEAVLERVVSTTDTESVTLRTALQLPQMNASDVSLVTQARICSNASAGLDAAQNSVNANRIMYVFKLGNTRFGVFEVVTRTPVADFETAGDPVWYFTNKWVFLSAGMP